MTLFSKKKILSQKGVDLTSVNSRITVLENNEYKVTYYEVVSGTSGSLTIPSQATINAGEFGLSGNAILSKIDGSNKPTFESPTTSGGAIVTASLTTSTGAWVTSGTYTDSSVALIYSIKIKAVYYSNLTYANIIETSDDNGDFLSKNNNLSDLNSFITARTTNLRMWDLFLTNGDQTTTSSTASNITDLVSITLTANKRYKIHGVIHVGCNNTGGVKIQVTIPTGATIFLMTNGFTSGSTTIAWSGIGLSATLGAAFCTANSTGGFIMVNGEVSLSSTAGTIQFGFASGVNTQTSTIYQLGTQIVLTQIN